MRCVGSVSGVSFAFIAGVFCMGQASLPASVSATVQVADVSRSRTTVSVTNRGWSVEVHLENTGMIETSSTQVIVALPLMYRYAGSAQQIGVVRTEGRTYGTDVIWNTETVLPGKSQVATFFIEPKTHTRPPSMGVTIVPRFARTVYTRVTPPTRDEEPNTRPARMTWRAYFLRWVQ